MARHSQTLLPKVRLEAWVRDGDHVPHGRVRPILLRLRTSSGCKIKVLCGPGLPVCPSAPGPARSPHHGPPGVTHSAWFQGIGSTLELASRCGL